MAERGGYFHHAIRAFGPERCMFESNFPVDSTSIGYTTLWNAYKIIAADYDAAAPPAAGRHRPPGLPASPAVGGNRMTTTPERRGHASAPGLGAPAAPPARDYRSGPIATAAGDRAGRQTRRSATARDPIEVGTTGVEASN